MNAEYSHPSELFVHTMLPGITRGARRAATLRPTASAPSASFASIPVFVQLRMHNAAPRNAARRFYFVSVLMRTESIYLIVTTLPPAKQPERLDTQLRLRAFQVPQRGPSVPQCQLTPQPSREYADKPGCFFIDSTTSVLYAGHQFFVPFTIACWLFLC